MKRNITEVAHVIRSKNSGPFEITFDIMFKTPEWFQFFVEKEIINTALITSLYKVTPQDILAVVHFKPASAIKFTLKRRIPSGSPGETDIYGAQQHAPLLSITFDDLQ
ncbi:DUF4387 domain-containing protein [Myxococcota bacterium]|nr:DUF4387 domain-containing protein [Myxococcota bacterium]MBU1536197.1 DUF4387 domain-containing protein [Myxococcota bacterium]